MFFSIITKHFNWEVLTKKLVTFKRWDEVKDENFNILRVTEKSNFERGRGQVDKKKIYSGVDCLKGWEEFANL